MGQYKAATRRREAGRQGAALCDKAESAETRELHQVNQRVPKQAVSSPAIYKSGGGPWREPRGLWSNCKRYGWMSVDPDRIRPKAHQSVLELEAQDGVRRRDRVRSSRASDGGTTSATAARQASVRQASSTCQAWKLQVALPEQEKVVAEERLQSEAPRRGSVTSYRAWRVVSSSVTTMSRRWTEEG